MAICFPWERTYWLNLFPLGRALCDFQFGEIVTLNKSSFIESELDLESSSVRDGCVRREPLFIEFRIHGNLIIMIEPMPEEDRPAMNKVIDEIVAKLP